jgi:DNA ligase 1
MSVPAFAALLDRLLYAQARTAKLAALSAYLKATPDPDRGYALAALTGDLTLKAVTASVVRTLIEARTDPLLFRLSYDYVGDLAETCALLWPSAQRVNRPPDLAETVEALLAVSRKDAPALLTDLLDRLDADGRYALIKLATGGLRIGVSARLAKTGVADAFGLSLDEIEELWHGLSPPYAALFAWGEGRAPRPAAGAAARFRPFMLAHPLEDPEALDVSAFAAEWKWDGIRVQVVRAGGEARLFSRAGEDITASFPDVGRVMTVDGVLDGELLVRAADGGIGAFNALQKRLGRKSVTAKMLSEYPAFVRAYDLLADGAEDLRALPLHDRRARLNRFVQQLDPSRFDVSATLEADSLDALIALRTSARDAAIEGLMLKRRDSLYEAGRKTGLWYKWKRDPLSADCVLMYAQRGHGKRSSFYSDYTFGCWSEDGQLLPVGKAYSGFTDAELKWLDKWVREHTLQSFGPVREVSKALVFEVAFDSIHRSSRHKSGLAMRFPRISRIRTDKPAEEADRIATLTAMIAP